MPSFGASELDASVLVLDGLWVESWCGAIVAPPRPPRPPRLLRSRPPGGAGVVNAQQMVVVALPFESQPRRVAVLERHIVGLNDHGNVVVA